MKLIVVTTSFFFPEENKILIRLFDNGLERLHVRKPDSKPEELSRLLETIPSAYRPRIVLHDHFQLTKRFDVGGVHLNRRNPEVPVGFIGSISRSCHTLAELEKVRDLDYLFLSPIFDSISKEEYGSGFPPRQLREASKKGFINERVIALGGISVETLPQLRETAFGGVAVLGALWGESPSMREAAAIVNRYRQLSHIISNMSHTHTLRDLTGMSRLMFITHRTDHYTELDEIKKIIEGGCDWVQLRMKNGLTIETARAVSQYVNSQTGCRCCLDDNLEMALQADFHCVHLGKQDMPIREARKRIRETGKEGQFLIGATANTFEDIRYAVREGADYIGLGPYRFTTTKEKLSPILGIDGYRTIIKQCREADIFIPIFAIGGIRFDDIAPLLETGVDGIAVSGALLQADDPTEEVRRFIREIKRIKNN